jgi:hypothetical protein
MYTVSPPTAANGAPSQPTDSLLIESLAREATALASAADDLQAELRSCKARPAGDLIPVLAEIYGMNRALATITKHLYARGRRAGPYQDAGLRVSSRRHEWQS